ncbi:transcription termination factor NusA [Candidatus Omnitrophota bacterium]
MSQELLAIVDQIEREKGIKREVLIEAIEAALLSAARKVINAGPEEELVVKLDPKTGKIRALRGKEEIKDIDFGRIAASTARQVIIQKIREAEKEIVFGEFQDKVGEIASGMVYRFERGNIIVDLLGKAEGVLLKREQSPKEIFRQGERIRAYIVDVRREAKGTQIILSRSNPSLVKKLFELEVPEIYEGIVEMKAIARQAGERTKIAVRSKNDKVDSVGACVGMRGNRVRNIVNELHGEKIDIVRYNDDTKEYIKAALSPAKIAEIKLDKDKSRAEVIVDQDQLSLAIGKHGQNVRLASRLIGWELDIRTKEMVEAAVKEVGAKEAEADEQPKKKAKKGRVKSLKKTAQPKKKAAAGLGALSGVGAKTVSLLSEAGFKAIADLAKAKPEDLAGVKGIGGKKAEKLIEEAKKAKG